MSVSVRRLNFWLKPRERLGSQVLISLRYVAQRKCKRQRYVDIEFFTAKTYAIRREKDCVGI